MSDLVELLNDLNQGNRIEYDDYSQLMFCVQQLKEENERLKQQIEKMKCCSNCKFSLESTGGEHCSKCENYNKWEWELAE